MAEANSPTFNRLDRFFPITMVIGLILVVGLVSFSEQDRRGLLLWDRPDALADGADAQLPGSYEIAYLGYSRASYGLNDRTARSGDRLLRHAVPTGGRATDTDPTGARRIIPGRRDADSFGSSEPLLQDALPLADIGPGSAPLIAQSAGNGPFTPGNLGGSGPTPPGIIGPIETGTAPPATGEDTPPVVPAVPEPAAWLLMILGVGLLAGAMRAQVRREAEPVT
jgi:hypothetical protein